jgi:hypothetical protein
MTFPKTFQEIGNDEWDRVGQNVRGAECAKAVAPAMIDQIGKIVNIVGNGLQGLHEHDHRGFRRGRRNDRCLARELPGRTTSARQRDRAGPHDEQAVAGNPVDWACKAGTVARRNTTIRRRPTSRHAHLSLFKRQ